MESRTRLAIGGMAAVAASVAVVSLVAMTTSVALADSPGVPSGSRPVIVPSPSAIATPAPTLTATPVAPAAAAPAVPETVPAPEPEVVVESPQAPQAAAPDAATEDQLVAGVAATGDWSAARAWGERHGWSSDRIDAWITHLEAKLADKQSRDKSNRGESDRSADSHGSRSSDRGGDDLPADADNTSGHGQSGPWFGSKREQSRVPPG